MDHLQRLLIDQACRELVLRAALHADANAPAPLAGLFTEDAVLARPNAEPLHGRTAIQKAYEQRPADRLTRHLVTNIVVDIESATQARAISYVLLWAGTGTDTPGALGRPAHRCQVGEFDDRFALTPDGWRIARREARFVLHNGS